jgi:hypothetical protein
MVLWRGSAPRCSAVCGIRRSSTRPGHERALISAYLVQPDAGGPARRAVKKQKPASWGASGPRASVQHGRPEVAQAYEFNASRPVAFPRSGGGQRGPSKAKPRLEGCGALTDTYFRIEGVQVVVGGACSPDGDAIIAVAADGVGHLVNRCGVKRAEL